MRVDELTGAALDWAVAKCEGKIDRCGEVTRIGNQLYCWEDGERMRYAPSDDWAQGGPIIDREGISLTQFSDYPQWTAKHPHSICYDGPTPLIAAMRCYVASKLGDNIDIPEELK